MKTTPERLRRLKKFVAENDPNPTVEIELENAADDLESYSSMLKAAIMIGENNANAAALWHSRCLEVIKETDDGE